MPRRVSISFAASAVFDLEDILAYYAEQSAPEVGKRLAQKTCTALWAGMKTCKVEHHAEITLLTPNRIEGRSLSYPEGTKFDCRRCSWGEAHPTWSSFTWIPE